jgi:AcrR family transcriptional regulator
MTSTPSTQRSTGRRRASNLPREILVHYLRQRAAAAAISLALRLGIGAVTVGGICKQARMSKKTFYENFENVSDCLDYSLAMAFEQILGEIRDAEPTHPWLASIDVAIGSFYAATAAEPALAEFCLVHSYGIPERSAGRDFEAAVELIAARLQGGREAAREELGADYQEPPPRTEDYLARTVVSLAALKLRQGDAPTLVEHRDEMVLLVASGMVGAVEAARLWRELRDLG